MKLVNVTKKAILAVATVALVSSNVEAMDLIHYAKDCVVSGCTKVKAKASSVKKALITPRNFVRSYDWASQTVAVTPEQEKHIAEVKDAATGNVTTAAHWTKENAAKQDLFPSVVSSHFFDKAGNQVYKLEEVDSTNHGLNNASFKLNKLNKVVNDAAKNLAINTKKGYSAVTGLVAVDIAIVAAIILGTKVVIEKAGLNKKVAAKVAAQISKAFADKDFSAEIFSGYNMEEINAKYEAANDEEKAVIVADLVNEIVSKKGFWDKVAAIVRK